MRFYITIGMDSRALTYWIDVSYVKDVKDMGVPKIIAISNRDVSNVKVGTCKKKWHHEKRSSDIRCVLCGGNHPANYNGGIVQKYLRKKTSPSLKFEIKHPSRRN
jgi:hypothetical protein